jgi:hypothetical protein
MACVAHASATRPQLEVAQIACEFGDELRRTVALTPEQSKVLRCIAACRTSMLGGHLDTCGACGHQRPSYNSCRNRHCPKCQALVQAAWVEKREQRLLPGGHFHLVFTLPDGLRRLVAFRRRELFDLLFASVSQTLEALSASRLGVTLGTTLVLHTWTRDLRFHPHLHGIVTAGGLTLDGTQWKGQPRFLFPIRVMGELLRGKFLAGLRALHAKALFAGFDDFDDPQAFDRLMAKLAKKRWIVYAKQPFGGTPQLVSYLGRYTHRVGISNQRLLNLQGDQLTFATKDGQTTTVSGVQFLKRFIQHVLPSGFVKIRHYGLYASKHSKTLLPAARGLCAPTSSAPPASPTPDVADEPTAHRLLRRLGINPDICPACGCLGTLRRGPLPQASPRLDSS